MRWFDFEMTLVGTIVAIVGSNVFETRNYMIDAQADDVGQWERKNSVVELDHFYVNMTELDQVCFFMVQLDHFDIFLAELEQAFLSIRVFLNV